jgi:hypothetical protein
LHHPRSWHLGYFRLHGLLLAAEYLVKGQRFRRRYPRCFCTLSRL